MTRHQAIAAVVVGVFLVCVGLSWVWPPLGIIAMGAALVGFGLLLVDVKDVSR